MSIFDLLRPADINAGVQQCRETAGAVLLDVRTEAEYAAGHIAGSVNLPLSRLGEIGGLAAADTPLFIYCQSGARAVSALSALRGMGYTNGKSIGGIAAWRGPVEKGA